MNPCAIAGIALAVLAGISGAWINGSRWETRYTTLERDHAQAIADAATASAAKRLQLIRDVKDANDELEKSRAENARLAGSVAAGATRLLVRATCPSLPAADPTAGGVAESAPELEAAARSDYFALIDGIAGQDAWIIKCREFARASMQ